VTVYDGQVFYGINGDRDAVPDIELFASFVVDSLAELEAAARRPDDAGPPRRGRARAGRQTQARARRSPTARGTR
jgi:hypothetical protein